MTESATPVNAGATPVVQGATESAPTSSLDGTGIGAAPPQAETYREAADEPHTGDDELLDALTGIRCVVDELLEGEHGTMSAEQIEALGDIYEHLKRADDLRVAELKTVASSSPETAPPMQQPYDAGDGPAQAVACPWCLSRRVVCRHLKLGETAPPTQDTKP